MEENLILLIKYLVEKNPNDYDLGKEVRSLINKINKEENQEKIKEEWGSTNGY
jgi:hypothetical protein